jgi:hypothetical protein
VITLPQVAIAALFIAMFVSLFLPEAKILLHLVAALTVVALAWFAHMLVTDDVKLEILCLPLLTVWFFYYAMCLFWSGNQSLAQIAGP